MPAVVKLEAGKGWLGECAECGIGPYRPGKQRDADYKEQVRRRLVDTYGNTGNLADPSMFTAEAQIPYTSLALEESAKAFPDNPEMQLAMYWLGPTATQGLVETYGQDWLSYVDMSTEMFVSRAMDVMENRPEGTDVVSGVGEAIGRYGEAATTLPREIFKTGTEPYRALLEATRSASERRRAEDGE